MAAATHIIGRQNIRVRYNGHTDVLALRSQISKLCSDELPVRLNKLFDAYDQEDFVLRIDNLDIQVNISDEGNLEDTLAKAIIEKVEAALRQKLEQKTNELQSIPTSFAAALQFYLEKGHLPWWSFSKDPVAFQKTLESTWSPAFLNSILPELLPLLQLPDARIRFIALLNEARLEDFILAMNIWKAETWNEWKECLERIHKKTSGKFGRIDIQQLFRRIAVELVISRPASELATTKLAASFVKALRQKEILITRGLLASFPSAEIRQAFLSAAQLPEIPKEAPFTKKEKEENIALEEKQKETSEKEKKLPEEEDSIFINNAGLVLLAAYLPAFFKNTAVLNEGKPEDIPRALSLLRYLAYGKEAREEFEEFEIVLEKLLCGISLSGSISGRHMISVEEKAQADELLQSAIEHWTVLKNTSPDGLRHNFLQREGRLLFKNKQWELSVQKQSHDILLDYLPWNISMIKLAWMPHLLIVKWNV